MLMQIYQTGKRWVASSLIAIVALLGLWLIWGNTPAWASLNDDKYDGNIFALYAGNGSLVPPKVTLAESLQQHDRATVMMFYLDDSKDCKQYSSVLSQLQAYYGRATNIIPVNLDSIPSQAKFLSTEPGYYYKGFVPQLVIFNQNGDVVLNEVGKVPFEKVDTVLRQVFDLLPRSESVELKRRQLNEVNTELVSGD